DVPGGAALRRGGARRTGAHEREFAAGGCRDGAGRDSVGTIGASGRAIRGAVVGAVHGGDGDGARGDAGGAAGEGPARALVAGGDHDGHAAVRHGVDHLRGRVVL